VVKGSSMGSLMREIWTLPSSRSSKVVLIAFSLARLYDELLRVEQARVDHGGLVRPLGDQLEQCQEGLRVGLGAPNLFRVSDD
jgi:hypothetical protein